MKKVVFVGLSNKPSLEPFDTSTNSGKVLQMIIDKCDCEFFKINLVDYAPLDSRNKLRYPSKKEIDDAIPLFVQKIEKINPDVIVSFGNLVSLSLKEIGIFDNKTIYKKHPSYIYVYKRKELEIYINDIINDIK